MTKKKTTPAPGLKQDAAALERAVQKAFKGDGFANVLSGLGGRRDKGNSRFAAVVPSPYLDRSTLAEAYRSMWLVRRLINCVPEEATRRGFGEIETPRFDELNYSRYAEGALLRAACLGRLMGGAGVYVGYANGGSDLTQAPAPGAQVAFLEVFHRFEVQGVESSRVRDTADPRYGQPEVWRVIGQNRTGLEFHHSRFVKFPGQPRADDFETIAQVDRDWWDSILQSVWDDVVRYGMFWQSVSHLMQISSIGVLKLKGLIQMLAQQDTSFAEARIDLLNEAMSITRLMMLDADAAEEYKRESVSFTDIPGLLQELQLATAGAFGYPVTKLFGRAPAGMNATGQSDLTNWYDHVDSWRETVLKPRAQLLMSACEGEVVVIEWPSLWEPTEKEQADTEAVRATTNQTLFQLGAFTSEEIRKSYQEGKPLAEVATGPLPERASVNPESDPSEPENADGDEEIEGAAESAGGTDAVAPRPGAAGEASS